MPCCTDSVSAAINQEISIVLRQVETQTGGQDPRSER